MVNCSTQEEHVQADKTQFISARVMGLEEKQVDRATSRVARNFPQEKPLELHPLLAVIPLELPPALDAKVDIIRSTFF